MTRIEVAHAAVDAFGRDICAGLGSSMWAGPPPSNIADVLDGIADEVWNELDKEMGGPVSAYPLTTLVRVCHQAMARRALTVEAMP